MPVIDEIREQHEIVKQKGFKYKFQYFMDYYSKPTLAGIIVIAVLIAIIHTFVTAKATRFEALLINASSAPDPVAFGKILELNEKKEEVVFDFNYYLNPDPDNIDNVTYTNSQKIMAVIAAKTGDVMIAPESILTRYLDGGVMADLSGVFTSYELEEMGDAVIWWSVTDSDTGEKAEPLPLAIDITKAPGLEGCFATDEPIWFGALINSQHIEDIPKLYDYLNK